MVTKMASKKTIQEKKALTLIKFTILNFTDFKNKFNNNREKTVLLNNKNKNKDYNYNISQSKILITKYFIYQKYIQEAKNNPQNRHKKGFLLYSYKLHMESRYSHVVFHYSLLFSFLMQNEMNDLMILMIFFFCIFREIVIL